MIQERNAPKRKVGRPKTRPPYEPKSDVPVMAPALKERLARIIADPPKKKLVRPPAVYSNKSREQYIDEVLNS